MNTIDLAALLADASPRPWVYRPHKHDDWGFIRSGEHLVAISRDISYPPPKSYDDHRRDGTDPYEANAKLIIAAVNNFERLVKVLKLVDNYVGYVTDGQKYVRTRAAIDEALKELEEMNL